MIPLIVELFIIQVKNKLTSQFMQLFQPLLDMSNVNQPSSEVELVDHDYEECYVDVSDGDFVDMIKVDDV